VGVAALLALLVAQALLSSVMRHKEIKI